LTEEVDELIMRMLSKKQKGSLDNMHEFWQSFAA